LQTKYRRVLLVDLAWGRASGQLSGRVTAKIVAGPLDLNAREPRTARREVEVDAVFASLQDAADAARGPRPTLARSALRKRTDQPSIGGNHNETTT
jgi:hypothetical protein